MTSDPRASRPRVEKSRWERQEIREEGRDGEAKAGGDPRVEARRMTPRGGPTGRSTREPAAA